MIDVAYRFIVKCTLSEQIDAPTRHEAVRKFLGQHIRKLGNHPGVSKVVAEDLETNNKTMPSQFKPKIP